MQQKRLMIGRVKGGEGQTIKGELRRLCPLCQERTVQSHEAEHRHHRAIFHIQMLDQSRIRASENSRSGHFHSVAKPIGNETFVAHDTHGSERTANRRGQEFGAPTSECGRGFAAKNIGSDCEIQLIYEL
jgi:hypothetical protein